MLHVIEVLSIVIVCFTIAICGVDRLDVPKPFRGLLIALLCLGAIVIILANTGFISACPR